MFTSNAKLNMKLRLRHSPPILSIDKKNDVLKLIQRELYCEIYCIGRELKSIDKLMYKISKTYI